MNEPSSFDILACDTSGEVAGDDPGEVGSPREAWGFGRSGEEWIG